MRGKKTQAKRVFRAPLIGDPGYIPPVAPKELIPDDIDLDSLSFDQLKALAFQVGINTADVLGMSSCKEHRDMLLLQQYSSAKYTIGLDQLYCKQCGNWFRERKPLS